MLMRKATHRLTRRRTCRRCVRPEERQESSYRGKNGYKDPMGHITHLGNSRKGIILHRRDRPSRERGGIGSKKKIGGIACAGEEPSGSLLNCLIFGISANIFSFTALDVGLSCRKTSGWLYFFSLVFERSRNLGFARAVL